MNKNIGNAERGIRAIVGLALLAWAIWGTGQYTWIGWIGVVPLVTAAIGWCPPYAILGINTCSTKKS
jgi:hypothetical protein